VPNLKQSRDLQQHEGGLTDNTEAEPEVDVAHLRVLRKQTSEPDHRYLIDTCQIRCRTRWWPITHLQEHAQKEPQLECVQRDTDNDLPMRN